MFTNNINMHIQERFNTSAEFDIYLFDGLDTRAQNRFF